MDAQVVQVEAPKPARDKGVFVPGSLDDAPALPSRKHRKHRAHRCTKPQLITRAQIDGRSMAYKLFSGIVGRIVTDLGGSSEITEVERNLIEAFAGAAVLLENMNTRLLLDEAIDLDQHAGVVSSLCRVGSRLGLQRRSRTVGPSLGDMMLDDLRHQRERDQAKVDATDVVDVTAAEQEASPS